MKLILSVFFLWTWCCTSAQTPTWSGDIAKLIYGNCTSCHRSGGIAPFALETYDEVSSMAGWVQQSIETKKMPPWTPDVNYKHFAHERVLAPSDIATFQQWVSAGVPSGNLNFAPPVPSFSSGSQLGTPDISLISPSFTISTTSDLYRNFELFPGNSTAINATAIEVIPGNNAIVHHVLVFQDSTSNPINVDGGGGTGSNASQLIYGFVPGSRPYFTPLGTGIRLAPNTRIVLQVHYAPGSNGQSDATTVNIKTDSSPLRKITINSVLNPTNMTNGPLLIPANEVKTFNAEYVTQDSLTAFCTFTHMHLLGQHVKVWANAPVTNDTTRIVWIPKWDFHWQDNYIFPNSVILPAGSSVKAEALYDNTSSNPNNPNNPPAIVAEGISTTDEMFLIFLAYTPYLPGDEFLIIDKRVFPKGATTFCEGNTVRLETLQGDGYTYQWYLNGSVLIGETSYFTDASSTGAYTVAIALGPNNVTSDPVNVWVNSAPTAQIQIPSSTIIPSGGSVLLSSIPGTGLQYQWYLNGTPMSGATSASLNASVAGTYVLEAFNGTCFALSDTLALTGGTAGINESVLEDFFVFQDPISGMIHLKGSKLKEAEKITLHDMNGRIVCERMANHQYEYEWNTSIVSEGTYLFSLWNSSGEVLARKKFLSGH